MTSIRTLNVSADTFDLSALFVVNTIGRDKHPLRMICYVWTHGDECGINQKSAMIKDSYTAEDRAHSDRLAAEEGVNNGDTVKVNGKHYRVKVNGNFSDAAVLIALTGGGN